MNYLEDAINKLHEGVYYTPLTVIKKIKKEKILSIIGNPKFKIKKNNKKWKI
jgi:polyribonucleotide nucleotidyltransferase